MNNLEDQLEFYRFTLVSGQLVKRFKIRIRLILFSRFANKFLGIVNNDLEFNYTGDFSLKKGCGVTLRDKFWYFGGSNKYKQQVSSGSSSKKF